MPLVAARCEKCGGDLRVDSSQEAAICEYCGTPFVVEKAIQYNTTTINVNDSSITIESLLHLAEIHLGDGEYAKADEALDEALKRSPREHRVHWYKLLAKNRIPKTDEHAIEAISERIGRADPSRIQFALDATFFPHYGNATKYAPEGKRAEYERFYFAVSRKANEMVYVLPRRKSIEANDATMARLREESRGIALKLEGIHKANLFAPILIVVASPAITFASIATITKIDASVFFLVNVPCLIASIVLAVKCTKQIKKKVPLRNAAARQIAELSHSISENDSRIRRLTESNAKLTAELNAYGA